MKRAKKQEAVAERRDWNSWCIGMASRLRGMREAGSRNLESIPPSGFDWLAVAIGNMGGIRGTCERLGVTRQTVYTWLSNGLGTLPFERVNQIAELGGIPLELLKQRMGPFAEMGGEARQ